MQNKTSLDNISIVLLDTKTPANIGAAARCMMNMGLSRLVLVRPPNDPLRDAHKLAAGADSILKQATEFSTLKEAIVDCGLVFGTSRHKGRLRKNIQAPREAANAIIPLLSKNKIAIVFGNEVNGLERDDLSLCHEIIAIPSSGAFASLNLSHSVMVIAYELFLASCEQRQPNATELASSQALEGFYQHLQSTLQNIEFLGQDKPERMMFTLRQLFGRSRLGKRDVAVLRGVLSTIERAARRDKR
jgi:tRNA/rRNA methyltransferase/tRNA (cytidine32/uridine32-2'-O)-methyltransferase